MTDTNSVIVVGRLTRDVGDGDFAFTAGGTARLSLSVAVNRAAKTNGAWTESASFFDVTVWGKHAEAIRQYMCKGKQVAVSGCLEQQRWEKDGQKFSKVVIVASSVQLLGGNDGQKRQDGDCQNDDIPF